VQDSGFHFTGNHITAKVTLLPDIVAFIIYSIQHINQQVSSKVLYHFYAFVLFTDVCVNEEKKIWSMEPLSFIVKEFSTIVILLFLFYFVISFSKFLLHLLWFILKLQLFILFLSSCSEEYSSVGRLCLPSYNYLLLKFSVL